MALSRSREFEADRLGAELLGVPRPLAWAQLKLDRSAHRVAMDVSPAQATPYIVEPVDPARGEVLEPVPHAPANRGALCLHARRQSRDDSFRVTSTSSELSLACLVPPEWSRVTVPLLAGWPSCW